MTADERRARKREWNAGWRRAHGSRPRAARSLTLDPILAAIADEPNIKDRDGQLRTAAENRVLGIGRQRRKYWRDHGITVFDFDRLAIRLGTHPALILGDAWWELEDAGANG